MEDVADGVPETTVTEETVDKESPESYKSDVDFLSRNDDKEEEKTDETPSEQAESELKEEAEKPEKVESEDEKEQPPLTAKELVDRLNKTNPDFLRKNKDVREAIYKSAQYSEMFSHPDEAKELIENAQAFDRLANKIMEGDARALLHNIEQTNKHSLRSFAKSFPLALYEQDKTVFYDEVATPIMASAIRDAIEEGKRSKNENLRKAAHWVSQYLFNQPEPPQIKGKERDPEKEQLQQELKSNTIAVYQSQKQEIRSQVDDYIASIAVKDLDKGVSEKLKSAFIRDVMDDIEDQLSNDQNHLRRMNALWDQFVDSKFNPTIGNRIRVTYANRAKLLLPTLVAKHKSGYFGNTEKKSSTIKPIVPAGGASKTSSSRVDPSKIDWRKTSDLDILNGRATLKK